MNVRSSIMGASGRAKEAQSELLILVEDAIRQPDLAKSFQRQGKGEAQPRRVSGGLADASEDRDKLGKRCR